MPDKFFYFLKTFLSTGPALFGLRGAFEHPAYTVRESLGSGLEIRDYPATSAVQAVVADTVRTRASETAFRLLFAYIAGKNRGGTAIAMTTPVQMAPTLLAMTTPVQVTTGAANALTMRFFLPARHAANPPAPDDPRVSVVTTRATTTAALRFSGNPTEKALAARERELLARLSRTGWHAQGAPYLLAYDPPFAIPFLKRNEIAIEVTASSR